MSILPPDAVDRLGLVGLDRSGRPGVVGDSLEPPRRADTLDPRRPSGLPEPLASLNRCAVMGVVNVTPDSFSDGGRWDQPEAALAHGLALAAAGADLIDVGGESTRPGAARVSPAEEAARVIPVVQGLVEAGVCVSIDTMRASLAAAAAAAGALIVNDVSGGLSDPTMAAQVADLGVIYVCGHWRVDSAKMDLADHYDNVFAEVDLELRGQLEKMITAGVDPARLVIDPGLGFSKAGQSNWPLLARCGELVNGQFPVLIGASRKRFLGAALAAKQADQPHPINQRDAATAAVTALAAAAGAWVVRVHAVPNNADAVRIAHFWRAAAAGETSPDAP